MHFGRGLMAKISKKTFIYMHFGRDLMAAISPGPKCMYINVLFDFFYILSKNSKKSKKRLYTCILAGTNARTHWPRAKMHVYKRFI